jgi:hypothetical protein
MDEIKKAHENYLNQRRESILHYDVKYEYDPNFSAYDKGNLTLEDFIKAAEKDLAFSKKWITKN